MGPFAKLFLALANFVQQKSDSWKYREGAAVRLALFLKVFNAVTVVLSNVGDDGQRLTSDRGCRHMGAALRNSKVFGITICSLHGFRFAWFAFCTACVLYGLS